MAHEWIKARLALNYVSESLGDYTAQRRICERAHSGLIAAKAGRIIWGESDEHDRLIGKNFWWAEGHEALEQDWNAGDFSTWIDRKIEIKAFDVSFDFTALSDLVPADKQALALRRISVIAHDDWISARELYLAALTLFGPNRGAEALEEACRLGQIGARAMRATCQYRQLGNLVMRWKAVEWDVPLWFWRDFSNRPGATKFDWSLGKVTGQGQINGADHQIDLQGLHFHRSGLINLGLASAEGSDDPPPKAKRGRKPEYDWPAANAAIWGMIVRGELIPESQAQIEKAFQLLLAVGDKEPSESTVRPHASLIWNEYSKA